MKPRKRTFKRMAIRLAIEVFILLALHAILHAVLANSDVVSRIFAASHAVPARELVTALAFFVVRFLAVLALPGVAELNIGHALVARALFVGLRTAVAEMRQAIARARP